MNGLLVKLRYDELCGDMKGMENHCERPIIGMYECIPSRNSQWRPVTCASLWRTISSSGSQEKGVLFIDGERQGAFRPTAGQDFAGVDGVDDSKRLVQAPIDHQPARRLRQHEQRSCAAAHVFLGPFWEGGPAKMSA